MLEESRERIRDYAEAARRLSDARIAWGHLRMMAEVCESHEVLETLAEALMQLGDVRGADRVYGAALGGELQQRKLPEEASERWKVVMQRIMTPPRAN
jgi:hypothetical protein